MQAYIEQIRNQLSLTTTKNLIQSNKKTCIQHRKLEIQAQTLQTNYSYQNSSIHCSMGSAPVGTQCPLTSPHQQSFYRLLGLALVSWAFARVGVHRPSLRSPSISRCFLFTLLHQPLDFIRLFFTVAVSEPHQQSSSLFQTWDWHYGNWISEKVEIPWYRKFFLRCRGPEVGNLIPLILRDLKTFYSFKRNWKKYMIHQPNNLPHLIPLFRVLFLSIDS